MSLSLFLLTVTILCNSKYPPPVAKGKLPISSDYNYISEDLGMYRLNMYRFRIFPFYFIFSPTKQLCGGGTRLYDLCRVSAPVVSQPCSS